MRVLIALLLLMFIALQFRLWTGENSLAHLNVLQDQITQQQLINSDLETQTDQMRALVFDLKNGDDAYEEMVRLKLGLIKEDEEIYLFVEPKKSND
ncbi:MAG: septum formation initiator family protein [Saccharospirillaceae bacterium]|nr:septum formation initiator family protein [Pseudomonadales bacterium]NRB81702.1 septum formation initiator family protein [Saccharospirillaceae bacterium]